MESENAQRVLAKPSIENSVLCALTEVDDDSAKEL